MSNDLSTEIIGSSMVVRFVRHEIRSPISISILDELQTILGEVAWNSTITRFIFTGKGDIFASGANLREIAEITPATASEFALRGQTLMSQVAELPQLTIAAVNGYCFGGALDLALACDRRLSSPNAVFCHPGASLGIMTGWGGTQRLPRLIGEACALQMFLTATTVDANEALSIGLIDEIVVDTVERAIKL